MGVPIVFAPTVHNHYWQHNKIGFPNNAIGRVTMERMKIILSCSL